MNLTDFEKALSKRVSKQLGYRVYVYYEDVWIIESDNLAPAIGATVEEAIKNIQTNYERYLVHG